MAYNGQYDGGAGGRQYGGGPGPQRPPPQRHYPPGPGGPQQYNAPPPQQQQYDQYQDGQGYGHDDYGNGYDQGYDQGYGGQYDDRGYGRGGPPNQDYQQEYYDPGPAGPGRGGRPMPGGRGGPMRPPPGDAGRGGPYPPRGGGYPQGPGGGPGGGPGPGGRGYPPQGRGGRPGPGDRAAHSEPNGEFWRRERNSSQANANALSQRTEDRPWAMVARSRHTPAGVPSRIWNRNSSSCRRWEVWTYRDGDLGRGVPMARRSSEDPDPCALLRMATEARDRWGPRAVRRKHITHSAGLLRNPATVPRGAATRRKTLGLRLAA
jgi:hypothetical protein